MQTPSPLKPPLTHSDLGRLGPRCLPLLCRRRSLVLPRGRRHGSRHSPRSRRSRHGRCRCGCWCGVDSLIAVATATAVAIAAAVAVAVMVAVMVISAVAVADNGQTNKSGEVVGKWTIQGSSLVWKGI